MDLLRNRGCRFYGKRLAVLFKILRFIQASFLIPMPSSSISLFICTMSYRFVYFKYKLRSISQAEIASKLDGGSLRRISVP